MQSARWVAIGSLGFLGVTAVVGAVPMLLHPGGDPAMLPLKLLQYSPFRSFLIPGIVLLVANGLLAFFVLWMVMREAAELRLADRNAGSDSGGVADCGSGHDAGSERVARSLRSGSGAVDRGWSRVAEGRGGGGVKAAGRWW